MNLDWILLLAIGVAIGYAMRQFYLACIEKGREIDRDLERGAPPAGGRDYGED